MKPSNNRERTNNIIQKNLSESEWPPSESCSEIVDKSKSSTTVINDQNLVLECRPVEPPRELAIRLPRSRSLLSSPSFDF